MPRSEQRNFKVFHFSPEIDKLINETDFENHGTLDNRIAEHWRSDFATSDKLARVFDTELAQLRESAFRIDHGLGWSYLNLQTIIYCLLRLKRASDQLRELVPSSGDIVVPWCTAEPDYYFDSEISRSTFVHSLRGGDRPLIKLKFEKSRLHNPQAYDFRPAIGGTLIEHIAHLPTTSYDFRKHIERQASKKNILDIQSPFFDIQVSTSRAKLVEPVTNVITSAYMRDIQDLTVRLLADHLNSTVISPLTRRLTQRENFQLNALFSLRVAPPLKGVASMDIADHDAGLQGPLMTFAAERKLKVDVWPHSTVCVMPFPASKSTTKNHCFLAEDSYCRLGLENARLNNFFFATAVKANLKNRNILLLHNQVSDIAGLTKIDIHEFRQCYGKLKHMLRDKNFVYRVRHKPKHNCLRAFGDTEEFLAAGDLSDWFDWTNICVSFGEVSTALIKLTQAGCRCAHLSLGALSAIESAYFPPEVKLFKSISYSESFAELEHWINYEIL
jgi:hypothetical protein